MRENELSILLLSHLLSSPKMYCNQWKFPQITSRQLVFYLIFKDIHSCVFLSTIPFLRRQRLLTEQIVNISSICFNPMGN